MPKPPPKLTIFVHANHDVKAELDHLAKTIRTAAKSGAADRLLANISDAAVAAKALTVGTRLLQRVYDAKTHVHDVLGEAIKDAEPQKTSGKDVLMPDI